jgi:Holliday junction resolvase RusA-like endonuclease
VKPWRQAIAKAVFAEWVRSGDSRPFTDPVVVQATFYLPKPKTVKRIWPSVAPDTDKLCRALGDALSIDAKAIQDDSLIVRWEATKLYAPRPEDAGVHVRVRLAAEEDKNNALLLSVTV